MRYSCDIFIENLHLSVIKNYTLIIVNIKCPEYRRCEVFQQPKTPLTQSLRSVLLNIADSIRQKR